MVWVLSDYAAKKMQWKDVFKELTQPNTWKYWEPPPDKEKIINIIKNMSQQDILQYAVLYSVMTLLYHTGRINKLGWDLHTENVMQRQDGTLVIIDPWFALNDGI